MKTVLVTLLVSMNLSLLLPCNGNDPVKGEGKESRPPITCGVSERQFSPATIAGSKSSGLAAYVRLENQLLPAGAQHTVVAKRPRGINRGER